VKQFLNIFFRQHKINIKVVILLKLFMIAIFKPKKRFVLSGNIKKAIILIRIILNNFSLTATFNESLVVNRI